MINLATTLVFSFLLVKNNVEGEKKEKIRTSCEYEKESCLKLSQNSCTNIISPFTFKEMIFFTSKF
jgi:hypothetical protein